MLMPADLAGDGEVISAPCWNCGKQHDLPTERQIHIDKDHPFTLALQDELRDWATQRCRCPTPERGEGDG